MIKNINIIIKIIFVFNINIYENFLKIFNLIRMKTMISDF